MELLVTFEQAVNILGLDDTILKELITQGRITSGKTIEGVIMVSLLDVAANLPILQRPEFDQFSDLANKPISISEAARKYDIPQQTLSRWVANGYIIELGKKGRKTLVDESQVAIYAKVYKESGGGQGKWIFKGGYLYQKKKKQ